MITDTDKSDHFESLGGKLGLEINKSNLYKLDNIVSAINKPSPTSEKQVLSPVKSDNLMKEFPENDEDARIAIGGKLGWKAYQQD